MNVMNFAAKLKQAGIPIQSIMPSADPEQEDHAVMIETGIHIQVPTGYSSHVAVVCEQNETFMFFNERKATNLDGIRTDIAHARQALAKGL